MSMFEKIFSPRQEVKPPVASGKVVPEDCSATSKTVDSAASCSSIDSPAPAPQPNPTAATAVPPEKVDDKMPDEFDESAMPSWMRRNRNGLTVELDALGPAARADVERELVAQNQLPLFVGDVEHAYTKAAVGETGLCPRCKSSTEKKCAHFIYATNVRSRVMLAPAGFFCTRCPTVIIDESILAAGMKPGLRFCGVVGINFGGRKEDCLFRTYNGRKPLYILDDERGIIGISTTPPQLGFNNPKSGGGSSARIKKRKRQLAKQARRRNRNH
jgi:hypothetical protein